MDSGLRIKRFTPRAADLFSIIASDIGRSLLDLTHKLDYDQLAEDVNATFDTLRLVEREVRSNEGRCGRNSRRRSGVGQGQSIDWGWGEQGHTRGCRRSLRGRRSAGLGQPLCLPGTGIPGGRSSPRPRVSSGWRCGPGGR